MEEAVAFDYPPSASIAKRFASLAVLIFAYATAAAGGFLTGKFAGEDAELAIQAILRIVFGGLQRRAINPDRPCCSPAFLRLKA